MAADAVVADLPPGARGVGQPDAASAGSAPAGVHQPDAASLAGPAAAPRDTSGSRDPEVSSRVTDDAAAAPPPGLHPPGAASLAGTAAASLDAPVARDPEASSRVADDAAAAPPPGLHPPDAALRAGAMAAEAPQSVAPILLAWYDLHARDLPWRAPPGAPPMDPYRVWLSEIMLQQTTVAAVKAYFERFTVLWPSVQALAAADDAAVMAEWAGLGYYARARNLVACARKVAAAGGFPATREGLAALPGIGPYTSAAIAAIAFGRAETVVDGNVERVVARLFAVETPLPAAKRELTALAATLTPALRPGDFAQAMMDLGATICTPRSPACGICPLVALCAARAKGLAADLPRRVARAAKPVRHGLVWVARDSTRLLVERRPARGLLGGTLGFPTTGWDGSDHGAPFAADWQDAGEVRHIFTHFELRLRVLTAAPGPNPDRGEITLREGFDPKALPGLMRKVWALAG